MDKIDSILRFKFGAIGTFPELHLPCPKCHDRKSRLYINVQKILGHCFHCGQNFSSFELKKLLGLDDKISIYRKTELPEINFEKKNFAADTGNVFIAGVKCCDFEYSKHEDYVEVYEKTLNFLKKRGLNFKTLAAKHHTVLANPWGAEKNRIILPIIEQQKIVYYQARSVDGGLPKYLNPKIFGYGKSDFVFNLDKIQFGDSIIICEGIFSAIAAGEKAIALLGKELSEIQKAKILKKRPERITILLDPGEDLSALKIADKLRGRTEVFIAKLHSGDPQEVSTDELVSAVNSATLCQDFCI